METPDADADRLTAIRRRLALLRWLLIGGLALVAFATPALLGIALPLIPIGTLLGVLAVFNVITTFWGDADSFAPLDLAGQLAVDLVALAVLLYLTGGAANPLVSLLLLPVIVAALSLPMRWSAALALLAIALYSFLMFYAVPLPIADAARAARLHLVGMWLTFVVTALLFAWFVTRMTRALRERDAQLAAAREEALRDAQVVALGQQAAGAAHELGTPLATINVLAGELAQDARLPADARADIELLIQQVGRCKEIVHGLTARAGIERATAPESVTDWLRGVLARWQTLWPTATCTLTVQGAGVPPPIIAPTTIGQALTHLLDNAVRHAPPDLRVELDWDDAWLRITVRDHGPGFPSAILRQAGHEPLPAAARRGDGHGIGLWLTRAAVERAGGRLHLANRGGGVALIELPRGGMS